jgi:hypothetical protein
MVCPICSGELIPRDASLVEKQGRRVFVQGRVNAIIPPDDTYSPYSHYATVSLYPRKGQVKYLKFKSKEEIEHWPFELNVRLVVEGCLHYVDGKELVFDITSVRLGTGTK